MFCPSFPFHRQYPHSAKSLSIALVQAESVTHHLSVPVLRHTSFKPSYSCIKSIRAYFRSLPQPVQDHELIIVGDRLLTDVIMANRMARKHVPRNAVSDNDEKLAMDKQDAQHSWLAHPGRIGPLAVWTNGLWKREALALRTIEKSMLAGVKKWVLGPQEAAWREELQRRFVKPLPVVDGPSANHASDDRARQVLAEK